MNRYPRREFLARTALLLGAAGAFSFEGRTAPAEDSHLGERVQNLLKRRGYIRLGLEEGIHSVTVSVDGRARLVSAGGSAQVVSGSVEVSVRGGSVLAGASGMPSVQGSEISIEPVSGMCHVNKRSYRGRIVVDSRGNLVNEVIVDDWLKGLLDAEIGSDSPFEALKAQAVAARSEAISGLLHPPHRASGYDFCTDVHCQAYKGAQAETSNTVRACEETFGVVLLSAGDVIDAVYHNVCGGVTAAAEDVWDSDPEPGLVALFDTPRVGFPNLENESAFEAFLRSSGTDAFCYPGNPGYAGYAKKYFRWEKSFSGEELGRRCGVGGTVSEVRVTERKSSGRVRKLEVVGAGGRRRTIVKELPIRHLLDLWSGLFYVDVQRAGSVVQRATFIGAGNGHGVGMCQHGAREIARRGGTCEQILMHYYSNATLKKLYRP